MIDPTKYTGFLQHHVPDIIKWYQAGETQTDIAKKLNSLHGWEGSFPASAEMVRYILRRVGFDIPTKGLLTTPLLGSKYARMIEEKDVMISLPSLRGTGKGRPIDMGGPRDVWIEDEPMREAPDPYYYSRDHDKGPGMWCVRGPDGFEMTVPGLDKSVAYIIGKLLSGKLEEADQMLHDLVDLARLAPAFRKTMKDLNLLDDEDGR